MNEGDIMQNSIFITEYFFKSYKKIPKNNFLSSRKKGKELRVLVEEKLKNFDSISIDFENVETITQSFCDEFLGVLIRKTNGSVLKKLKFKNASEPIKQTIILVTNYSFHLIKSN